MRDDELEVFLRGRSVRSVDHDRVELDALIGKVEDHVDVLYGGGVVQMNGDGDRGGVGDIEDEAEEVNTAVVTKGEGEEEDHGRGFEGFGGIDEGEGGGGVVAVSARWESRRVSGG